MTGHPLARSEGIFTEEVGDELVVYDQGTQNAHALRKDAASVWRYCDGDSSVKDIARRLGLEHARVEQALEELSEAELIERPDGISRRALYKRGAQVGAAAVSAPLIYSVAIRPATAHASPNTFACPPSDLAGRPLMSSAHTGSTLFCRYETVPNDFFCRYFATSGLLEQDHDAGFCPPVAIPAV